MIERPPWKWDMNKRTHCFLSSFSKMAFFREPNDAMAAPRNGICCDLVTRKGLLLESNWGPNNVEFGPLVGSGFTSVSSWPKRFFIGELGVPKKVTEIRADVEPSILAWARSILFFLCSEPTKQSTYRLLWLIMSGYLFFSDIQKTTLKVKI